MIKVLKFQIRICVEPDGDGFYAYCPKLGGVHEDGDTVESAIENAKESALVLIESIIKHNDPFPLCVEEIDIPFSAPSQETSPKTSHENDLITRVEDLQLSFA